jgi:hypothetical protein
MIQALNAGRQDTGGKTMADHIVQSPHRYGSRKSAIWAAILLLGSVAAVVLLAFDGFARLEKSANVRVSQAFEDMERTAPVSDGLKSALASLSRSVQSEQKPPVRATGE